MNTIENAKNELKTKELTFVAMGVNSTWEEADYHTGLLLNKLREDKNSLSGTVAAAHRIGRADALLLCYGGIRELFAEIISIPATEALRASGIKVTYEELVDVILPDRAPEAAALEQKCLDIRSAFQAYEFFDQLLPREEAAGKVCPCQAEETAEAYSLCE